MLQNKNKFLLTLLVIVIILGGFFRLSFNDKIYTEYDDIEVLGLYKTNSPGRSMDVKINDIIDVKININMGSLKNNLLDSWLFPVFMGYTWTYPPGQYVFFPLLINESDSYFQKLKTGRGISGVLSFLGLPLFLLLLYWLNNNKLKPNMLVPVVSLSFAFNLILYSHHISPYALSATTFILALLLLVAQMKGKISLSLLFVLFSFLTYFNYLIILIVPPAILTLIFFHKIFKPINLLKKLALPILLYLIIFLPGIILFLKAGSGARGEMPPEFSFSRILEYLFLISGQFISTLSSTSAFFTKNITINIIIASIVIVLSLYFFIKERKSEKSIIWYLVGFIFVLWLEWIILYALGKMAMGRSRHLIMWTPAFSLLIYYLILKIKLNKALHYTLVILLIFPASYFNLSLLKERFSVADYSAIESQKDIDTILSYSPGDSELKLYFPNKKIYNINGPHYDLLPDELLLYSQTYPIEYLRNLGSESTVLKDENIKRLFEDYNYEIVKQIETGKYFTFDNTRISSCPNNFYLYKLTKK